MMKISKLLFVSPILTSCVVGIDCLAAPVHFVGFDLGTSGARISVVKKLNKASDASDYVEEYSGSVQWDNEANYDDPTSWKNAVDTLMDGAAEFLPSVVSICFSGTSASCILIDSTNAGQVTRPACMYNFDVVESHPKNRIYGLRALERIDEFAPPQHTTSSPTSSLAKLLTWNEEERIKKGESFCHQADYLAMEFLSEGKVCGSGSGNRRSISSDWHNCLKLGYDVRRNEWPSWIVDCLNAAEIDATKVLPQTVVSPGVPLGTVSKRAQERFNLSAKTVIVGGTTDSNAAFFAACSSKPEAGTAVTSLGSTLAIKQTSNEYIEDASVGVYSHRFPSPLLPKESKSGATWLVGGASNVGCAVLRQQQFSGKELAELSLDIDPTTESTLKYYPLTRKGERFPVADSSKQPILEPSPDNRTEFLHGILQGISDVEAGGYEALRNRGADPSVPHTIFTCGGGSINDTWTRMRQRRLSERLGTIVTVVKAGNSEASFGAAILAAATF